MTAIQYDNAEKALIARLQAMRETEHGNRAHLCTSQDPNRVPDPNDDVYDKPISTEHQEAFNEWNSYCWLCKSSWFFPKKYKQDEFLLTIGDIRSGTVEEKGDDMKASDGSQFKTCNLADYLEHGYFDLISFISFNQAAFPYIYKLTCCLSSLRTCEVGCERFFSIAGYVSNPRRTKLNVHNYERIAMLKRNMQQIYIDEELVLQDYINNEKNKLWDADNTREDIATVDLETDLFAENLGLAIDQALAPDDMEEEVGMVEEEVVQIDSDSDTDSDTCDDA